MTGLYIALVLVVVAAFVGMLWLRRVSDAAWARHRAAQRQTRLFVTFVASTAVFSAAMKQAAKAAADFEEQLKKAAAARAAAQREAGDR